MIRLQALIRRWLAQQRVERLRRERNRRLTWLEAMERGWRQEKEEQLRDRRQRWKNPRRREDFNLLYHALESRLTPLILYVSDTATGSGSFLTMLCSRVVERRGAADQCHPAGGREEGGALRAARAGDAAHRHHWTPSQRRHQQQLGQEHQEVPGQGQRSQLGPLQARTKPDYCNQIRLVAVYISPTCDPLEAQAAKTYVASIHVL